MAHDHAHPHDHGHDHSHAHDHGHSHDHAHGAGDYFLEHLLMIFVCGAFGTVAVLMVMFGRLNVMLVPEFHTPVLVGGAALLLFTVIRGVGLWAEAGAHEHSHDEPGHVHGPDCDHTHDHSHADHGHDHGSVFWRVVVLLFPLLLFVMGLPNEGFSKEWIDRRLGKDENIGTLGDVKVKDGAAVVFDFNELSLSAHDPARRAAFEGRPAKIKGQFRKIGDREFTLFRMKMTCCAADTIPLKARIVTTFVPYAFKDHDWVEVSGVVQFVEIPGSAGQFLPVLRVSDEKGIQKSTPEA